MTRAACAACLAALLSAGAAGATPSEQVPIGPRAIGMGGAFTSLADDATAAFWNPAGLARVGHQEFALSHANLFGADIQDNFASFVLPLSPDQAVALDWYHSGFNDATLDFGENRVDLAWSLKVHRLVWAGVGGKLVTRGTSYNGTSLSDARGFGMDLGLLAIPMDRLHVGLVAQDAFDTRVRDSDGASDVAYPRNLRLGLSYAWRRWGTMAFDLDDRWHLGAEVTPIEQAALRFGIEKDLQIDERATWSAGLGLKAGLFRVDWAYVSHPMLEATNHFALAMEFNFNPAQVRLEKLETKDLYTSLYKSYANEPLGTVQVRNLQDRPLTTRVSVFVPELMEAPSEREVILRPKAVQEVPLTAVLAERALEQRGDQPVTVQVAASYQSRRLVRKEKANGRAVAYAPGAIDWSAGVAQAAAFVTPRDPAVDALARAAGRLVALEDGAAFGNRNIGFAAAIIDALAELGVAYVPDPQNPFATIAETAHAVDTIHYPYQTLERRSGDCDDTTVLLASLLANVGVATRFVDAPGHIFLLVDTGIHERNRMALGVDSSMVVTLDEGLWIPLETTALRKGFTEAWRAGAQEVASWGPRGELSYVDVAESQARYEPAQPPGERKSMPLDEAKLTERLAADAQAVGAMREAFYAAHFGSGAREMTTTAEALAEVAHVTFLGGDLAGARSQLEQALARAPQAASLHSNLGVVLAGLDSLERAEEQWRTALALGADDPGIWLNLGLVRWVQGDTLGAPELLARGIAGAGGYAAACRLLALPPDDSTDRASAAPLSEVETRSMLRRALKRVPVPAAGAAAGPGSRHAPPARPPRPPRTRIAATRATQDLGLHHHLYWIE